MLFLYVLELNLQDHHLVTQSGKQTRIVISLAVNKPCWVMMIERWEVLPRARLIRASSPIYIPTKVQALTLQAMVSSRAPP